MKAEEGENLDYCGRIAGKTSLSRKGPVHGPPRLQMFLDETKGDGAVKGHDIDIFENK